MEPWKTGLPFDPYFKVKKICTFDIFGPLLFCFKRNWTKSSWMCNFFINIYLWIFWVPHKAFALEPFGSLWNLKKSFWVLISFKSHYCIRLWNSLDNYNFQLFGSFKFLFALFYLIQRHLRAFGSIKKPVTAKSSL